ncbi:hypothetical protein SLS53_008872 [Cytospora paraplurivora]|uniref:Major facilitator superfamily (MFS) profile domain-containing protein n=1 Tax=Cytospora paraplurivora TaxID=2898453 RepID=A0AAN9YAV6_9PEZI
MADEHTQGLGDVDSQTSATTASGHNTSPDAFHEKQDLKMQAHSNTNTNISDVEGGQNQAASAEPVAAAPKPDTSPAQEPSALQLAIIVVPLCAALFLAALDITIVTTALPTIVADFNSSAGYTWIGSAYLLTNAAFTPTWGKLSDIWGRKPILLLVAFIFFVGSTLAATSVSISMLIVARCIQGLGGGGLVVLVNICVSELVVPSCCSCITIMTLGFGLLVDLPDFAYWPKIILYQLVAGIGVGANLNAPLVALQANVNPGDIAPATATFFFTRVLSSAVSVVIGGVVFQNQMQKHFAELVLTLGPDTARNLAGSSASTSVGIVNGLSRGERRVARAAYHDSLRIMWIVYIAFAAVGMLASAFVSKKVLSASHNKATTGLKAEEEKRKAAVS